MKLIFLSKLIWRVLCLLLVVELILLSVAISQMGTASASVGTQIHTQNTFADAIEAAVEEIATGLEPFSIHNTSTNVSIGSLGVELAFESPVVSGVSVSLIVVGVLIALLTTSIVLIRRRIVRTQINKTPKSELYEDEEL